MFTKTKIESIKTLKNVLSSNEEMLKVVEILHNSTYYYCCGTDIMPIVEFAEDCSLFVYADTIKYGRGDFEDELAKLYSKLTANNFTVLKREKIVLQPNNYQAEIAQLSTKNGNVIYLLYVKGDAKTVYHTIYIDLCEAPPKCICNYRYELRQSLTNLDVQSDYVLGHCFSKDYNVVKQCKYFGDYAPSDTLVNLYQRI